MAGANADDTRFGPTQPSLLDFLKKVLREYTDGQIMKEIVQNAEDAEAKTVRFLYDCREHGTSHLHWPSLAPYQGRALYAYNDALFQKADWMGIQKPSRSSKEDNPLKVGRFGIGFTSVYHLTDVPSILSGETLAFIDPIERHFGRGETGTKLDVMKHTDIFNSPDFVDQFTPYNNLFPDKNYSLGCAQPFDGTLFRFPIRQESSVLCENEYDDAAMVRLLESFVSDADVVLLFLRSLETIEISRRIDQAQTQIRSRVGICPESLALLKSERERFSSALKENSTVRVGQRMRACLTHQLTLIVQVPENKRRMDWIVSQVVGGSEMPADVESIADKQGYIPWVGTAMPYNMSTKRRNDFNGRVFCFLPLPPGDESLTGLPVHIHGFFGVNSDRRSIKWPGADRIQGDIDAKWNFLLVTKLLPDAYMNMLTFAIQTQKLRPDEIYRAWPDPSKVRPQWERLLKPVYHLLIKHPVIYTTTGDGTSSWDKIENAVFNFLTDVDENTERILLTVLKKANVPVAEVPQHIKNILQSKEYVHFNAKAISAEVIIDCIHKTQHAVLESLSSEDKLTLLEYIMARTETSRLIGLRLLPLANGEFVPFSTGSASTPSVFIPTQELDQDICYNMGSRLILPNVNANLLKLLKKAAEDGSVHLHMLSDNTLARLIRDTLPEEWFVKGQGSTVFWNPDKDNQPPRGWLEGVWNLLNTSSRKSLEMYVDLPLIQVEERPSGEVVLAFLKKNSTYINQSYGSEELEVLEKEVLTKVGLLICSCPTFIDTARLLGDSYLRSPSRKGVVAALAMVPNLRSLEDNIRGLSKNERQVLLRFCTGCSLNDAGRNFLRQVPLFDAIPRSPSCKGRVMSASDVNLVFCRTSTDQLPKHHLPQYDIICSTDDSTLKLLSDLGVNERPRRELLKDIVNAICTERDKGVLEEVGMWILHDLKSIRRDIGSHLFNLKSQAFILTGTGQLRSPDNLLDPKDPQMCALFDEGCFPSSRYVSEGLLGPLREIGLRHHSSVTAEEIARSVTEIIRQHNVKKADILISFLGGNQNKLKESLHDFGQNLEQFLADKKFIPCLVKRPDFYPQGIPWQGSEKILISPTETVVSTEGNMLASGATIPFPTERVPHSLQHSLGVKERPNISNIVEQMAVASECHGQLRTPGSSARLEKMIHASYGLLSNAGRKEDVILKLKSRLPSCIWTGTGFVEIRKAVMSNRVNDFHPYICSVPQEFSIKYETLFLALGVKKNISPTQICGIIMQIQKSEPMLGSVEERMKYCRENKRVVQKALIFLDEICKGDLRRESQSILVPTNNESYLELVDPERCVFLDVHVRGDSTEVQNKLKEENTFIVDGTLPLGIVRALGIQPLGRKLLAAEDLAGIEQAGQYEPLTTRLKNIIKDSYLESSIPKEMIQNAEDAGATKVHFMLDLRQNSGARSSLFDKGMNDCQGPALWIYNDACFTPEDFQNITKLGGATKELDTSKIGRFGLGFNSVYHLTDVPSFLSGNYLQVFDPHATHLSSMLKSKESPGIRMNLHRNNNAISMFKDQFAPYEGIFNCSLRASGRNKLYDGTLFRLPLRSREAATRSEISNVHYDEHKCKSLLSDLWRSSDDLLVFTQNIHQVSAFVLLPNGQRPSDANQLFTIAKESEVDRDIMAEFKQSRGDVNKQKQIKSLIKQERIVKSITPYGKKYLQVHEEPKKHELMSVACIGKASAQELWQTPQGQQSGLAPVGGVAVKLPLSRKDDGKLYNGLPLSVPQSHLPCHCNGFFAISADRRNLWKPSSDSEANFYTRWNEAVFQDILSMAYITLLTNKDFQSRVATMPSDVRISGVNSSPENFYRLWPNNSNITQGSDGYAMLHGFYKALVTSDTHIQGIFWEGDKTWSFKEAIFVDPVLHETPHVASAVKRVLQREHTKRIVTEMPVKIRSTLERLGFGEQLNRHTCSQNDFFQKYFLPQISLYPSDVRDHLIHYCLSNDELRKTLRNVACIPTTPDGKNLKKPAELIHPTGKASTLFAAEDGRFPFGDFASRKCLNILVCLGMVQDDTSVADFIQCAQKLSYKPIDHEYDGVFLEYLTYRLRREDSSWVKDQNLQCQLKKIAFLPVVYKIYSMRRASCDDIYVHEKRSLVSEVAPVLDESKDWLPSQVKRFLGIITDPPVPVVLQQLQSISAQPDNIENLTDVCQDVYSFLDLRLKHVKQEDDHDDVSKIREFFYSPAKKKCLLVHGKFRTVDQLALEFEEECIGSHLFRVPDYLHSFSCLLSTINIKRRFSRSQLLSTLKAINDSASGILKKSEFEDVMKLLRCLVNVESPDPDVPPENIYVPDSNGCLRTANELSFCDVDWVSVPDDVIKAHEDIPITLAKKLGIQDIRQHILDNYSVPVPGLHIFAENVKQFGQREPLTERIKNILKGYPCDDTILKELVQNADDSCATEVHLVLDLRTHPNEHLFRDEMSHLQGPALCVYNNKAFTNEDIEGIQRLGVGSKRDLSSKAGRFGIGFNAVYHLTDCPSFYTNGDTLGMFDPNVLYVPNATLAYPGFMAKQTDKLKGDFPNVFNCYLPEFFKGQDSTIFRLPLRTEIMAGVSKISSEAHDANSVKKLMRKFKQDLPDLLLFLNNVKKVSISTIDEKGEMKDTSSVQACVSEMNESGLDTFLSTISSEENDPVTGVSRSLEDIPVTDVYYEMSVTVTEQEATGEKTRSDDWLIYQQHGFESTDEVPASMLHAYNNGHLHVLPLGGVAVPLGKQPVSSKAYSFLPLPIDTGLPVHVNGSIELDERRRDLWIDREDVRAQWNRHIMKEIISPAYVKALCYLQTKIMAKIKDARDECEICDLVSSYTAVLPVTAENSFWKELITDIYRAIADSDKPMFPSIRRRVSHSEDGDDTDGVNKGSSLEWKMPLAEYQAQGFFDSPITDPDFRSVVSNIGFPLIECSQSVQTTFAESLQDCRKWSILVITPDRLISHLSSSAVEDVGLASRQLPKRLCDTVVGDSRTLQAILEYCSKCDDFQDRIENLPLLATSDGLLRKFSAETPVYNTEFDNLFPSSRSKFVDISIRQFLNGNFDVIRKFDIPCVASLMREELCPTKFECKQYVQWDKSEPTEEWIIGLWKCLAKCRDLGADFQYLSSWSILPCRKNEDTRESHHLVPLSKATSVMNKLSGMTHLLPALCSLGVSEVDRGLDFGDAEQLITEMVAHEERPETVLTVFDHIMETDDSLFDRLTAIQRDHILQYLAAHMPEELVKSVDNRRIIKNLPCYKRLDMTYVSLSHASTVYVIRARLPDVEIAKWMAKYNDAFLREDDGLEGLFKAIGCVFLSECDTMSRFIFPEFHLLSTEARLKHLEYVQLFHKPQNKEEVEKSWKLQDFPLLEDNDGVLRIGKEFFDKTNKVFSEILPERKFPSKGTINRLDHSFLLKFGIQAQVTEESYLKFAEELSDNLKNERKERKKLARQSETLVKELFHNCTLHTNDLFLSRAKFINFIVPDAPEMSLQKLHPYHTDMNHGIGLDSSCLPVNDSLVWCSMKLLPKYFSSIPKGILCDHKRTFILEKLGVVMQPIPKSVIENVRKMCCRVHDQGKVTDFRALSKVMEETYKYLKSACDRQPDQRCSDRTDKCNSCQTMCKELADVPCVVIQSVPPLVRPSLVCRELSGDLFHPHLFQMPDSLIPFSKLLYCLGSTRTPSFPQLATVLNGLAKHSVKEMKKNPNKLKAVMTASQLFLQQIETLMSGTNLKRATVQAELEGIQVIHFPASSKGNLMPSTEIFSSDGTDHTKRLIQANVPFLPDAVTKQISDVHALVDIMPQHLKLRSVKACVTERIDTSARPCLYQQANQCTFGTRLSSIIASKEFAEAIQRLLEVESDDDTSLQGLEKLKRVRIQCMAELPTTLYIDGKRIEGSEANSTSCMTYDDGDATEACIRVAHPEGNKLSAYMAVLRGISRAIVDHLTGIAQEHLLFLADMLSADSPKEIPKLLRSYNPTNANGRAAEDEEDMGTPNLGSRIPADILHLLEQDPYVGFFKGEYVAYQIDNDLDVHVKPIHVYAQVLDVPENLDFPLCNKYLIDIGEEDPVWVSGLNLFKFLMPEESEDTGMWIMVYCHSSNGRRAENPPTTEVTLTTENQNTSEIPHRTDVPPKSQPYLQNIEKAKERVTARLEEIWKLDENARRKAISRLYLKWHPDKNPPERKLLATEVFKHLLNEIKRLKAGRSRHANSQGQGSSSGPSIRGGDSFDEDFFAFMESWAREEGRRRESYQRTYRERGHFGNSRSRHCPPSFDDTPGPNMPKASSWFKQAKADLASSYNDLGKDANEWMCYKCYHAAEKALKAAQFASRGTSNASHNLEVLEIDLRNHFSNETVTECARQLNRLIDVNTSLYPDDGIFRRTIPCDKFSRSDAERARQCASDIVEKIQNYFNL